METEPRAVIRDSLLALVATHTSRAVVITDATHRILWVNPGFTRLTGYTLDEAVGHTPGSILQGRDTDPRTREYMRQRLSVGLGFSVDILNYAKSGHPHWVETEVQPVRDAAGQVTHYIGTQTDVTEKRLAWEKREEQTARSSALARDLAREKAVLEGIISTIPHAVFWKDRSSRYLGCNRTLARLAGVDEPAQLVGKTDFDCPWREQAADYQRDDRAVIESGEAKYDIEEVLTGGDGKSIVLLTSKVPLRNGRGEVDGVLGVFADITEHKTLEHELAQARKLESIGQLAAGIAHEINTPTQYVTDNTRFVADSLRDVLPLVARVAAPGADEDALRGLRGADLDFVTSEIPKALEQSLEGLAQIARIVRAMKDFSHPGEELAPSDLNAAISSTIVVARHEWKYVAEVVTDLDPALGPVPCRVGDVKQALLNLIVNAAHAIETARGRSSEAKGTIRVSTRRAGPWAEIRVEDDGCGIPDEIKSRIYDPFFTTKAVGKGTGQGLSIVHSVVKKHGGTISVQSQVGRGTTFTIQLPLAPKPKD